MKGDNLVSAYAPLQKPIRAHARIEKNYFLSLINSIILINVHTFDKLCTGGDH